MDHALINMLYSSELNYILSLVLKVFYDQLYNMAISLLQYLANHNIPIP